jgi:ABC-type xylose transport system permease subunit
LVGYFGGSRDAEAMTFSIWAFDLLFIALVVLQIRERPLTRVQILLPVVLVMWASITFVHTIPTETNSLIVLGLAVLVGAALGAVIGIWTGVRMVSARVVTRAGVLAAGLWILVMGLRLGFQLWATGAGQEALGRFDYENGVSNEVWPAALVLMAGATVVLRIVVLVARTRRLKRTAAAPTLLSGVRP